MKRSEVSPAADSQSRLELVVFCGDETSVFPLPTTGSVTLGREEGNAVCIDHPSVSRQHAVLHLAPLVIEDLGAANGTCVRDSRGPRDPKQTQGIRRLSRDRAELAVGDCVLLGTACAVVRHAPKSSVHFPDPAVLSESAQFEAKAPQAHDEDPGVVIRDPAMLALYAQAYRAARASISVMLLGETGVGKEVLARAIHTHSPRAGGPFLSINCAALSETLLESELFGYERGAFTGAVQSRAGLFEAADGGTLFLDEVGDASLTTQVKLLRVVEERSVLRLGSRAPRKIDVRILSATNRDPESDTNSERFRQDLYFRLGAVTLKIPPLRARPLDILPLATAFALEVCRQLERAPIHFATDTVKALLAYLWPGNVRELKNAVERSIILAGEDVIRPEHLPPALRQNPTGSELPARGAAPVGATPGTDAAGQTLSESELDAARFRAEVKALDRERIREALERASGNQTQAARLLGISRRTLVSRLREFDLPRPRKRGSV